MAKHEWTCMKPYPLGAYAENGAVRFSFISNRDDCGVLVYDRKTGKKLLKSAFAPEERIGNIHCKYLPDVDPDEISYQFYEGDNIVPDRYARRFAGQAVYGRERRTQDWKAVIPRDNFDWEGDGRPGIPYSESICYCVHVRGFTKHTSSGVAHRGTFLGMAEKLDYLQETGVTTVELQPAYEFAEIPTVQERRAFLTVPGDIYAVPDEELDAMSPKKCNYWGYKHGYYYAPKAAYAAGDDPCTEFKAMIRAFHKRGMEVVMQFYFPKTVKTLEITDILKFWVLEYHVDGFHLMGENLPVNLIAADEMLADTKLWYYYFDAKQIYDGSERTGYKNLAVYGDDYLRTMRKYLKGDENMLDEVLFQMRRIPHDMGRIHYMSNYEGFTLMDTVSYDRKHNEANGEDNRDGNNANYSWNCGDEGPSRRRKVRELRHKQVKNAMMFLLLSQSTPLIFMGDEFGNSQKGNNNPYCQDNGVAWLDWRDLEKNKDLHTFWCRLAALRREHPILHPETELKLMDYLSCGYPDLSYHGQSAWQPRTENYHRQIGIMYCGKYARCGRDKEDAFFYLAMNMYWEPMELAMPKLPADMRWQLVLCTEEQAAGSEAEKKETAGEKVRGTGIKEAEIREAGISENEPERGEEQRADKVIAVPGRSCALYVGVPVIGERRKKRGVGRRRKSPRDDKTAE